MKKLFSILIAALILLMPLTATADTRSATLSTDYSYDETTGNIIIVGSFVDISAADGIISVKYDFEYDPDALELVSVTPKYPDKWQSWLDGKSDAIEDLSREVSDGVYRWEVIMFAIGEGVNEDNELGVALEFKPLGSGETEVKFIHHDIIGEVIDGGMTDSLVPVNGNSVSFAIDLENPNEPEIKDDMPDMSDDSVDDSSVTSSDEDSSAEDHSSNPGYQGNVSMPVIDTNNSTTSDSDAGAPSAVAWILIGVGIFAVVASVLVLINGKKGKK